MHDHDHQHSLEYIPRAAEEMWTGTSGFQDVTLHGFVVKADSRLLDDVLTRYIDRPSEALGLRVAVRSAFSRVLLLFIDSERVQLPIHRSAGLAGPAGAHREQLMAVVVFGSRTRPSKAPIIFAPYVYSSVTPGWRTEREIYGFPQQRAKISRPDRGDKGTMPAWLEVETSAISKFEPNALSTNERLLRIEKTSDKGPRPVSKDELAREIANALTSGQPDESRARASETRVSTRQSSERRKRLRHAAITSRARFGVTAADTAFFRRCVRETRETATTSETGGRETRDTPPESSEADWDVGQLAAALMSGSFRMLFLKQFRDVVYADRACYQAIVEAPIRVIGYERAVISKDYRLMLASLDTAPISRELGVPDESEVSLAFRVQLEQMTIGDPDRPGTVLSNPFWNPAVETPTPDERSQLPKYVERGGEAVWRHPSLLIGARIYGFGITVPLEHQKKMLDRYVNDVAQRSPVTYGQRRFHLAPCADIETVMLMFVEYQRVTSGTDDDRRLGGVRYREFLAMQLALSDDEEFPELDWLVPFIYLDEDAPRLGGREIFGYPKQLAEIPEFERFDQDGYKVEPASRLELRATVIARAKDVVAHPSRSILRVEGISAPNTQQQYKEAADMIQDLLRVSAPSLQGGQRSCRLFPATEASAGGGGGGSLGLGVEIFNALVNGGVGHVFLKQFRDCSRPDHPCYQAVCKTDTVPGRFRGGARLDAKAYRIFIENMASERLLDYLRKSASEGRQGITPDFAYWMDVDAELTTGRVIANAFETEYVPDRTKPAATGRDKPRRVRRSREPVL